MEKIEKIKKLAQECLDFKWRSKNQGVFSQCAFCIDATKDSDGWPIHDCNICVIDKLVCARDSKKSLIGYFSNTYKENEDSTLPIGNLSEEDYALMIKSLEEMAKRGKISKSTRKSIKEKIKSIEI